MGELVRSNWAQTYGAASVRKLLMRPKHVVYTNDAEKQIFFFLL